MKMNPRLLALLLLGLIALGQVVEIRCQDDEGDDEYEGSDDEGDYGGEGGEGAGGYGDYGGGGGYGDYGDYGGGGGGEPGPEGHINGVLDLDDLTFDKIIDGSRHAFVEFYAPWCGHCKEFKMEYEEIGEQFGSQPNLILAKVNADESEVIAKRFGVEGFPTFKYFPKGSTDPVDYEGERDADGIYEFLAEKAGEAGTVESLKPLVEEFLKGNKAAAALKTTKAAEALTGVEATFGSYYVKVMGKIREKGDTYVQTEFDRLGRMLDKEDTLRKEKQVEFKNRRAVLKVFGAVAPPKEEEEEEDDDAKDEL